MERTELAEIVQCCSLLCVTVECVRVCAYVYVCMRERERENERMRKSKRGRGTCGKTGENVEAERAKVWGEIGGNVCAD